MGHLKMTRKLAESVYGCSGFAEQPRDTVKYERQQQQVRPLQQDTQSNIHNKFTLTFHNRSHYVSQVRRSTTTTIKQTQLSSWVGHPVFILLSVGLLVGLHPVAAQMSNETVSALRITANNTSEQPMDSASNATTTTTTTTITETLPTAETTKNTTDSSTGLSTSSSELAFSVESSTMVPDQASTSGSDVDTTSMSSSPNSSSIKLKPVNFTLVDEIFQSSLSESEVVKRWHQMDLNLQDGMKAILKMIFPQIVSISQDAKVSGDCSGGILKWILSLRNLRSWAIKMLDATGKPTAGVFEGSLTMFGNYRQCLGIRAPDEDEIEITEQFEEYFRGQYCVLHLKPWMPHKQPFYHLNTTIDSLLRRNYKYYEKTLYDELAEIANAFNFLDIRMDLCVPSTCTVADIQRVAELLSSKLEMRAKVMRCDIAARHSVNGAQTNSSGVASDGQASDPMYLALLGRLFAPLFGPLDTVALTWLAIPMSLLLLVLLATLVTGLFRPTKSRAFIWRIIDCFSIGSSIDNRLVMSAESLDNKPARLYGLRNLFVIWFIIVQLTVELRYQYLRESLLLRNMLMSYWPFQIIINPSLLFESLLIITAFTYSFSCLEASIKRLVGYVIDKYLRLAPAIVLVIALTIATPHLDIESPVWRNFVEQQANVCRTTGHVDLLFLQNFVGYDKMCLPHTWLLCVELQLLVLSIPIVLLFKSNFSKLASELKATNEKIEAQNEQLRVQNAELMKSGSLGCEIVSNEDVSIQSRPQLLARSAWSLFKSKTGILATSLILAGVCTNFFLVYQNQLPPAWFYTFPDVEQKTHYFGFYLIRTWTHLSAFMVGLIGGHLCRCVLILHKLQLAGNCGSIREQRRRRSADSSGPHLSHSNSPSLGFHSTTTLDLRGISSESISATLSLDGQQHHTGPSSSSSTGSSTQVSRSTLMLEKPSRAMGSIARVSLCSLLILFMATIIFSTFGWSTTANPDPLISGAYDSLSRLLWSLCLLGLMVMMCLTNDQSNFNYYEDNKEDEQHQCQIQPKSSNKQPRANTSTRCHFIGWPLGFGHPFCFLLGRLSFLAYLISPLVNTFVLAVEEQSMFPSLFIIFHLIVGNIVIIYVIAFILAIVIEQPIRRLVSEVFSWCPNPLALTRPQSVSQTIPDSLIESRESNSVNDRTQVRQNNQVIPIEQPTQTHP